MLKLFIYLLQIISISFVASVYFPTSIYIIKNYENAIIDSWNLSAPFFIIIPIFMILFIISIIMSIIAVIKYHFRNCYDILFWYVMLIIIIVIERFLFNYFKWSGTSKEYILTNSLFLIILLLLPIFFITRNLYYLIKSYAATTPNKA